MAFDMGLMLQALILNRFSIHLRRFVWNSHSQETAASYVRKNVRLPFLKKNMVNISIKNVSKDFIFASFLKFIIRALK